MSRETVEDISKAIRSRYPVSSLLKRKQAKIKAVAEAFDRLLEELDTDTKDKVLTEYYDRLFRIMTLIHGATIDVLMTQKLDRAGTRVELDALRREATARFLKAKQLLH